MDLNPVVTGDRISGDSAGEAHNLLSFSRLYPDSQSVRSNSTPEDNGSPIARPLKYLETPGLLLREVGIRHSMVQIV